MPDRPAPDVSMSDGAAGPSWRLHHVGVAVSDVRAAAEAFRSSFGAVVDSDLFHDAAQGVRILFVRIGDLRVELLEPAASPSPLDAILRRGVAVYHVCYEVDDLDVELAPLASPGVTVVSPPTPAVAFDMRRVAFVMQLGMMVELLEARRR